MHFASIGANRNLTAGDFFPVFIVPNPPQLPASLPARRGSRAETLRHDPLCPVLARAWIVIFVTSS
jgi:hypothetical protein